FTALAVTEDHYLVAAFAGAADSGLLVFDLMAGGPPVETIWPAAIALVPFDMAQRRGGGVWILDRVHARLWELDRRLAVVSSAQAAQPLMPGEADVFQPTSGAPRQQATSVFPGGIDLAAVMQGAVNHGPIDPIAIDAVGERAVLILDRNEAQGRSRVFRLAR